MGFNLLNALYEGVEKYAIMASKFGTFKDLSQYCSLDCAVGISKEDLAKNPDLDSPYILVDDNRTMITAFDLQGTQSIMCNDDFDELIQALRIKLSGYLNRKGHQITISFERDPYKARKTLLKLIKPQLEAAHRIGINADNIILDKVNKNEPFVAFEQNILVVYTHLSVFNTQEQKSEIANSFKEAKKIDFPNMEFAQNPIKILKSLKVRHDTILQRIESDLSSVGIIFEKMSSKELLVSIKAMIDREKGDNFAPYIIGDKLSFAGNDFKNNDKSNYFFPKLKYQLCNGYFDILNREMIKVDKVYHANFSIYLSPQETQYFSVLFNNIDKTVPWRVKYDIYPDGLSYFKGRKIVLAFANIIPSNKDISNSFAYLNDESKKQSVCAFKITFSTWADSENDLIQRVNILEKSVQSWGICQTNNLTGDAFGNWVSTIPAFSDKNLGNRLIGPLDEILAYLPLQRPATPWAESGDLILRTPDGKIYPVGLGSSLQDTWITLISAPPGSGKSVLMNSMNAASTWGAGNKELPLKTIIDVGESSFGYISLIKDSLPESRKHEAMTLKLQNSKDFAVNTFDTQLGCRYPTIREREFNIDFLTLLCTSSSGKAPDGVGHVCTMLIDIAYKNKDLISPNGYERGVNETIDSEIKKLIAKNLVSEQWLDDATWFEITDLLFKHGQIATAGLAQRYASPTLPDFSAYLKDSSIVQIFENAKTNTGEPLLDYVNRCFTIAASSYALFNGITRFEISSETKVISIDLNDVIGNKTPEGKIRTAIMYLFARQLAAKNYFLKEEILIPLVPELYKEYHLKRINNITSQKKTISYDETHNVEGIEMFEETQLKDGREGRKWGIVIINASQYLTDHPEKLRASATNILVMKGGNQIDNDVLKDEFKLTDDVINRLNLEAVGPRSEGGTFLAIFKTKKGTVVQMLTNTIGPIELWAFSSTLEDVALRKKLTAVFGSSKARDILAKEFPSGTAVRHKERISKEIKNSDSNKSVIDYMAEMIIDKYKNIIGDD